MQLFSFVSSYSTSKTTYRYPISAFNFVLFMNFEM